MTETHRRIFYGSLLAILVAAGFAITQTSGLLQINLSSEKPPVDTVAGYPDLFAEYLNDIKTAAWESEPTYPQNYLMDALSAAKRGAKSGSVILPWVERGPANVGGRTRAIVVDPDDPSHDTWYAAAVSGGIWKTTDAGLSWATLTPDLPNLAFSTLVQAASNPEVLYAGTGEGFFNGDAVSGAGVFKSIDRGNSWIQLAATASDFDFRYVNRLVVSPADENLVLAATREGVFRSDDGGDIWTKVYSATSTPGVLQIIADPSNFNRLYASESGVGVVRSTDAGLTWSLASVGLFGLSDGGISSAARLELAIAPSDPQRLYASVEAEEETDKLFMSPDGGNLWVPVVPEAGTLDPDWMAVFVGANQGWYDNAIAVDPFDENRVFLGGIELYEVTLGGTTTISVVKSLDEENTFLFLDFVSFVSATHFDGRMKTGLSEPGATITEEEFVSVEVRFGLGLSQKAHRFIPPDGPGILFSTYPYADYVDVPFEVWDIENNRQLAVSFRDRLDDGAFNLILRDEANLGREYLLIHAETYTPAFPNPSIAQTGGPLHKLLFFFWPILADEAIWNPESLPLSTLRINVEIVEGLTRTTVLVANSNTLHVDQHAIIPIVESEETQSFELLVGNDGGIFYSPNEASNFIARHRTYNTSQFYGVDKRPGVTQFVGGTQDNGTWRSFGNPNARQGWLPAFGGDGFEVAWNQDDEQLVLGSVQFNDIWRSTDKGANWISSHTGLTDVGSDGGGQFITSLHRSFHNPNHVFTIGESGVWKSTDFGGNWSLRAIAPEDWGFSGSGKVRVSLADGSIVWAGYEMGLSFETVSGHVHVSTDAGETFTAVPTPEDLSSGRISAIATHPAEPETAYVLFSSFNNPKILRTRDLGQTWEDLSGFASPAGKESANGFPNVAVHDLLVLPDNPSEIWAGTEVGLFISRDDGESWEFADNGLPAVSIFRMRIVDDLLIVATHGRGVFTVDTSALITSIADDDAGLPAVFNLEPNYPNPFNPSTTIEYSLAHSEDVRIEIFDMIGRRVAVLVDDRMPLGVHRVRWDASGFASGAYVVQMTAGSFAESRKMMFLK